MAIPPFRVKAIFEYSSPHDDDLRFPNGQIITVTDEEGADWYYGEYLDADNTKHQGLFPRNFVEKHEPETPPRPSRPARPKKDVEVPPLSKENELSIGPERAELSEDVDSSREPLPSKAHDSEQAEAHLAEDGQKVVESREARDSTMNTRPYTSAVLPAPSKLSKPAPPPVTDKPSVGSFQDRIAAFNKPAAAPVAPMKPGGLGQTGGSGFVKKPFVALPPSKNAYVPLPREPPPQRVYRREEDPEIVAQTADDEEEAHKPVPSVSAIPTEQDTDQPKPTTLKERIALLQKQQMEQTARHADAVQKKEKPKRPPKKRTESYQSGVNLANRPEGDEEEQVEGGEVADQSSMHTPSHDSQPRARSPTRRSRSIGTTPVMSPTADRREFASDANDADQSGAGDTEGGEEVSTGKDDSDEKPQPKASTLPQRTPQPPAQESDVGDEEDDTDEEEEEEDDVEEEVDPELKRRIEIRERMAKMSGGMGMAGMLGIPSIPASTISKKPGVTTSGDKKASTDRNTDHAASASSRAPPVPILPLSGGHHAHSPEQEDKQVEVVKEEENPLGITLGRDPEDVPDVEDAITETIPRSGTSEATGASLLMPRDRPVPPLPPMSRPAAPPPIPNERPVPPPPPGNSQSRRHPLPSVPMSPSAGSESDDEMSSYTSRLSLRMDNLGVGRPNINDAGRSQSDAFSPPLPARFRGPQSPTSQQDEPSPNSVSDQASPMTPSASGVAASRPSRIPPVPISSPAVASPPQTRAPPPPPPTEAPPSRRSTTEGRAFLSTPQHRAQESEGEVTGYEGDDDTDTVSDVTHKEASRFHPQGSSIANPMMDEESLLHHSGLPSLGPPPVLTVGAPRAVPPPPPNQPPKSRHSGDMPRAAPPAPPSAPKQRDLREDDYVTDIHRHGSSRQNTYIGTDLAQKEDPATPRFDEQYDDLYSASPPRQHIQSPPGQASSAYTSPPVVPPSGRTMPRQSMEVPRSTASRRSMDAPRPSGEQGFIASDVDLGQGSQWWIQRHTPPPVFQNRRDVNFEVEETTSAKHGREDISKQVYVLFMDYSQTIITAEFDSKDPRRVDLQQRHEPPPPRLRQDQLEDAHIMFGARIAEQMNTKQNTTVGDGTPHSLVTTLLGSLPNALPPVGARAYGALVYANLANASVQQHDEIRSGDIVTFRNTKFQGHRGPMHQKYSTEVGKPDHVGIVVDWDGTKKKVRAWEQGRESKKVKMESFKLGDMRSGEVKVWRVMARSWVGWGGQS